MPISDAEKKPEIQIKKINIKKSVVSEIDIKRSLARRNLNHIKTHAS